MAHEIDMSNGQANFAFVGAEAWHGLGNKLEEGASIERWKEQAGLAWEAKETSVQYAVQDGSMRSFPERKLIYRSDNNAPLGVVSTKFNLVQPGEMLEFYRDLTETAGFTLETAGSLFGGRKFFALARCGKSVKIAKVDEVKPFLLIASACDGTMATSAHFTTVRVVCNNTLRMAIGSSGQRASVRVPHNAEFDPEAVKKELGIAREAFGAFVDAAEALARFKLHRDDAIDLVAAQLKREWKTPEGADMNDEERLSASPALRKIIALFDGAAIGSGLKTADGTAWGLLNAMTEYYDHHTSAQASDRSRAFERANITDRANNKVQFANALLEIAK